MRQLPLRAIHYFLLFGLFLAASIDSVSVDASQTSSGTPAEKVIEKVLIRGLSRTREEVILQYVAVRAGDKAADLDIGELATVLERLRIFSRISILLNEKGENAACRQRCTLIIDVKEKWSLYPIPVYVKYRDTEIGGAFLVESNALGENKGVALGALISNRGWQGLIGFTDPHIRYSRFTTTLRYLTGRVFIEDATPLGQVTRSYTLMRHDIQSATGYQWRSGFFAGVLAGYRSAVLTDEQPLLSSSVMNLGMRFKYSSVTPKDFFQSGLESTLDLEKGLVFAGENLHVISSASAWHVKTARHQFLSILFSFQYSHYPQVLEQRLGGWQGTRTLPALLVPADQFAVGAINYQYGFLHFSWATFSALVFVDAGLARRDGQTPISFWGPGTGMRMYLKEITVPALGVDIARDMLSEQVQLSFFIGYNLQ